MFLFNFIEICFYLLFFIVFIFLDVCNMVNVYLYLLFILWILNIWNKKIPKWISMCLQYTEYVPKCSTVILIFLYFEVLLIKALNHHNWGDFKKKFVYLFIAVWGLSLVVEVRGYTLWWLLLLQSIGSREHIQ